MKGQFFISSIVVIAVILIVSMTYANSAEELRIDSPSDLEFDNYRNAYKDTVPDDWTNTAYSARRDIGICVPSTSETGYVNTTINITPPSKCNDIHSPETIYISSSDCWVFIKPSELTFDSHSCKNFYIYYTLETISSGSIYPVSDTANGTIISNENISISPHGHIVSDYREKNILVNETSSANKVYNVSYKSDRIDYTGQL